MKIHLFHSFKRSCQGWLKCTILLLAVLTTVATSGCATEPLKPWQRGVLARPDMKGNPDPLSSQLRDHIYFSKEGSSGSASAGGGGCGCN
jgi:hypothetical protein